MVQTASPGRRLAHLAVAAYVVVQIAAPIPALVAGFHRTEGYFSWNMFAHRYSCAWDYTVTSRDGAERPLDLEQTVNDPRTLYRIFHFDVLPSYHRWLCDHAVPEGGRLGARARCRIEPDGFVDLVPPESDVCRAENLAVAEPP